MRILFVHTIGRNKYGGGERWVVNAASGLQQAGHHCIIASKGNSLLLRKAGERNLETLAINIFSDVSIYHSFMLWRVLKKHRVDLVISKRRDLAVAGLAARWAGRLPVIVRSGSPPHKSLRKHVFLIKKLADGLVTNTNTIRDIYRNNSLPDNDFVKVIYNGLLLDDQVSAFNYNAKFPGKTIVLCAGRLNAREKGYIHIIDALQAIRNDYPNVLVYVLGEGKDKSLLEALAKRKGVEDMICFAGYVDQPAAYMKSCDVFLHPSLFEGMPNAAMEAMAYGKPVIMTDVNGAAELSLNGKLAFLIPPANHTAIAEALITVLDNPEKFAAMASMAKSYVRNNYTIASMITALDNFISEKAKQKRR
jgi:glycosyltransferase involved in cell wall biosynthesis